MTAIQHLQFGLTAEDRDSLDESAWHYARAGAYGDVNGVFNLALLELKRGRLSASERHFDTFLKHRPNDKDALRGLAQIHLERSDVGEAVRLFQRADSHSEALYYGLHRDSEHRQLHRQWASSVQRGSPLKLDWDGLRPLRVGYLGIDALTPIMHFMRPVILNHDLDRVEVRTYKVGVSTAQLWEEKLDVAVDLLAHMGCGANIPHLAAYVAPIQCSYLVAHGSGLSDVTRISDKTCDPSNEQDAEKIVRLPTCYCAYAPNSNVPAELIPHEGVVFGCLQRTCKITLDMASFWGEIIFADASHKLVVLVHGGEDNHAVREMLVSAGVPQNQLSLVPKMNRSEYLRLMGSIDVMLDTQPYAGHTTACDALWQGVPTVTLKGNSMRGRVGASLASVVPGISVAYTEDQYVQLALSLDTQRTTEQRRQLREAVRSSPLLGGKRVARALEDVYYGLALQHT